MQDSDLKVNIRDSFLPAEINKKIFDFDKKLCSGSENLLN